MCTVKSKLTILFEDPFWIGLYERSYDGLYEICKITFGSEPKEHEVYYFLLKNWRKLKFSKAIQGELQEEEVINPKRKQREISRQMKETTIGTKAQQALQLQYEANKIERKKKSREGREAEKQRQFELRQEKRKKKHRGH